MGNSHANDKRADRAAAAARGRELAELDAMTVGELAEKHLAVFGTATRTRNKEYLRKRLAWRLQELAEGGLSPRALDRIEQLAPLAPTRWRQPVPERQPEPRAVAGAHEDDRDPRLPAAGATLMRRYEGTAHTVTVLEDGFEYQGLHYRSLSGIARLITGRSWNGFTFFLGRASEAATATASDGAGQAARAE